MTTRLSHHLLVLLLSVVLRELRAEKDAFIQGLKQRFEEVVNRKDARIARLESELSQLKCLMTELSRKLNGGAQ